MSRRTLRPRYGSAGKLVSRTDVQALSADGESANRVALSFERTIGGGGTLDLRRPVVVLAVVAAHLVLLVVIGRAARQVPHESAEIAWIPLSITDAPRQEDAPVSEPVLPEPVVPRATPLSVPVSPPGKRNETPKPVDESSSTTPSAPIDWFAEARSTANALDDKARRARERRSLDGPSSPGLAGDRHGKPPCPFEKCEGNWGEGFSVFKDHGTKKGRIEKTGDGEVIRWTSEHCYQTLITPNILHRAMTRCVLPLGKKGARGDLFRHMKEPPPPPPDRATDVP